MQHCMNCCNRKQRVVIALEYYGAFGATAGMMSDQVTSYQETQH